MANVASITDKISGLPLGKSWGLGSDTERVMCVRRQNGEWAVHAGWLIPEAMADDPGSVRSLFRQLDGKSHASRSAYYATMAEALADFVACADNTLSAPLASALRVEEFSTRVQS